MKRTTIFVLTLLVIFQHAPAQTTFHGNAARTGAYASPGPVQTPAAKWIFKTEGPIFSSPAVVNGVVFVGSADTHLYAVDQKTGKQKWKFKTGGQIASSPAVADGLVYFGSYDGGFYALDAETGTRKWRFATEYETRFEAKGIHGLLPKQQTIADGFDVFTSSPAVYNNKVYFGSGDKNVYAVDSKTGILHWKYETKGVVHSSPAVYNDTIYVGSWDSHLYALDASTGVEKWRFKAGDDPVDFNQVGFTSSPAIIDGTIYIGCRDAHLYAIDAATGRKKWDYPTNRAWVTVTPAVRDGAVYFGTGDSRRFNALDAGNGSLKFSVEAKTGIISSPALAGDLIYTAYLNGRLYALDIKTGKTIWEYQTESAKRDPLKVLNPDGTRNASFFAPVFNDFQDMYISWSRNFSVGAIVSSPVVESGEIYFGSTDGLLYALR